MSKKVKQILSAIVAWIFAAWIFVFTANLTSGTNSLIRPEYVPRLVAVLLIVFGIIMFIDGIRTPVTDAEKQVLEREKEAKKQMPIIERFTPILTLVLITLFLLSLRPVGFTVSAAVYLTLQMTLLSGDFSLKSWIKYAVIGVVSAVLIFFIFRQGFSLKIPINSLGF